MLRVQLRQAEMLLNEFTKQDKLQGTIHNYFDLHCILAGDLFLLS